MNNIRSIFQSENTDKIPIHFWEDNNLICYYPSSGYDFRHIFYWDHICLEKSNLPNVYLYSDLTLFDSKNSKQIKKSKIFKDIIIYLNSGKLPKVIKPEIIDQFFGYNKIELFNWTELFLKDDIVCKNHSTLNFPEMELVNQGKIIALQCRLVSNNPVYSPPLKNGDKLTGIDGRKYSLINEFPISILVKNLETNKGKYLHRDDFEEYKILYKESHTEFLVILASIENSNFFYDIILQNNLQIRYLTHIMDGGESKGLSKLKSDYIYLFTDKCGIENILVDQTVETKFENSKKWLNYYHNNPKNKKSQEINPDINFRFPIQNMKKVYFPESRNLCEGHHDWEYKHFIEKRFDNYESNWNVWDKLAVKYDGQREKFINKYYHYQKKQN